MFTGIIEDLGKIESIGRNRISISTALTGINAGDSISINGICLTVINVKRGVFDADFSNETASVTNLGKNKAGDKVNLERAMPAEGRFGGHIVTGHVETTAKIVSIKKQNNAEIFSFETPLLKTQQDIPPIVNKGSVSLDGISLTTIGVTQYKGVIRFSAAVIPFTLKNTTLGLKKTGDTVNLETDILSKYVMSGTEQPQVPAKKDKRITAEFLKNSGFLT